MTNYEEMTDDELNYAVAMRGCEIVESPFPNFLELTFQGKSIYTLQKANWAYSAAIKWAKVEGKLPNWATDLNAAARLDFDGHALVIERLPEHVWVSVRDVDMLRGHDDIEARARVIAWLLYQDAIGGQV